jgi:hypothetical protein
LNVRTVTPSKWECDKTYPVWEHHPSITTFLGYDPFTSCGLQDPYSNESPGVAVSSPQSLGSDLRRRRLERKLTLTECAEKFGVDPKSLRD